MYDKLAYVVTILVCIPGVWFAIEPTKRALRERELGKVIVRDALGFLCSLCCLGLIFYSIFRLFE